MRIQCGEHAGPLSVFLPPPHPTPLPPHGGEGGTLIRRGAFHVSIRPRFSCCIRVYHSLFICKNLYFFFQTVSGEIVKVIGNCPGKPLCLSSPQFVAGIHLAVSARGRKRWIPAKVRRHDGARMHGPQPSPLSLTFTGQCLRDRI